eukprot:4866277-Prymnesium_polylepis.1
MRRTAYPHTPFVARRPPAGAYPHPAHLVHRSDDRPSRWREPDTQDVASDAALDGYADGAIGIVLQHVYNAVRCA